MIVDMHCIIVVIFNTYYYLGMQSGVILAAQPYGLGLNETLIPQYLKELGYATHGVGKVRPVFSVNPFTPNI